VEKLSLEQAVLRRDLRKGLRRIMYPPSPSLPMTDQGVRWLLQKTQREVDQIPEGKYAVALLQREVDKRGH
jgi:hypothetical protein